MTELIARTLCRASCQDIFDCHHCGAGPCDMWPTFMFEARAAIETIRDQAMLTKRNKPKGRTPVEICEELQKI